MALETGLNHGWRMEGNSNDAVGVLTGTDTAITYNASNGKITQGAGFASASPSRIVLSAAITGGGTIQGWVKTSSATTQGIISYDNLNGFYFRVDSGGTLSLVKQASTGVATSSGTVADGNWHQVGVTYDSSGNYVFYIDGASSGSGTNLQTFTATGGGTIGTESSHGENMNGDIDELYTWTTIKTGGEFTTLYNSGKGMYYNGSIFVAPVSSSAFLAIL